MTSAAGNGGSASSVSASNSSLQRLCHQRQCGPGACSRPRTELWQLLCSMQRRPPGVPQPMPSASAPRASMPMGHAGVLMRCAGVPMRQPGMLVGCAGGMCWRAGDGLHAVMLSGPPSCSGQAARVAVTATFAGSCRNSCEVRGHPKSECTGQLPPGGSIGQHRTLPKQPCLQPSGSAIAAARKKLLRRLHQKRPRPSERLCWRG